MQQHVTNFVKAQRHKHVSAHSLPCCCYSEPAVRSCPHYRVVREVADCARGSYIFCSELSYSATNIGSNFGQGVQLQCASSVQHVVTTCVIAAVCITNIRSITSQKNKPTTTGRNPEISYVFHASNTVVTICTTV